MQAIGLLRLDHDGGASLSQLQVGTTFRSELEVALAEPGQEFDEQLIKGLYLPRLFVAGQG